MQTRDPATPIDIPIGTAWRYLGIGLGLCLVLIVGFAFATSWLVRTRVEPRDNLTRNLVQLTTIRAPVVAAGDSRMAFDFVPGDHAANLSYVGENIEDMNRRLRMHLASGATPKVVLLQATPHLFSTYRLSAGLADYLAEGDKTVLGVGERHLPYLFTYWKLYLSSRGFASGTISLRDKGGLTRTERFDALTPDARRVAAGARAAQQMPVEDIRSTPAARLYETLVSFLIDRGIAVCMVNLPVSPEYLQAIDGNPRVQAARDFYRQVAAETGARYIDLERSLSSPDDLRYFTDADHLTPEGASVLTGRLIDSCPAASDIVAR